MKLALRLMTLLSCTILGLSGISALIVIFGRHAIDPLSGSYPALCGFFVALRAASMIAGIVTGIAALAIGAMVAFFGILMKSWACVLLASFSAAAGLSIWIFLLNFKMA